MAQFTQNEIDIIRNGSPADPFRVLLTTNEADSLILRAKSEDISPVSDNKDLLLLVQRLLVTMDMEQGVGIAAPQVGVLKNVLLFVRTDQENFPVDAAINPRIVNHPEETVCFEGDGCLSVPEQSGNTFRYPWIEVEYTNIYGEIVRERLEGYSRAGNFAAVIFQHEFDHLQGTLFTDKICPDTDK